MMSSSSCLSAGALFGFQIPAMRCAFSVPRRGVGRWGVVAWWGRPFPRVPDTVLRVERRLAATRTAGFCKTEQPDSNLTHLI
jgi:hypothetical protein